jgi:hypothetical protein
MIGRVQGQIAPAFEVVRRKVVRVIRRNNLGMPAYTSEKARRAEQMFTACQSRLSTKT